MSAIQVAVLGLVSLILGIFVVRPILTAEPQAILQNQSLALPPVSELENTSTERDVSPEVLTGDIVPSIATVEDLDLGVPIQESSDFESLENTKDPAFKLRELIEDRQEETVEIIRSWMADREEAA
jgi:flagellar M-ring protein FliF